ncbi:Peptidase M1 membrane alanine aminopeptidase [Oscillochloris trichoides DG-6]|uniref:Peptidase M1 membrane alanine aminopeptidase n=1 Tax=Oscillochloris trichoides DG-6 TaxID=765420 RepID=E1II78_9CHLR|nr:M1 family metallopeptidase [Oscillochloris trichoides]EFO79106.1 Peptidase M1 membrane alanine aminopeptidase [Oscillochloris trichoides DG-6]
MSRTLCSLLLLCSLFLSGCSAPTISAWIPLDRFVAPSASPTPPPKPDLDPAVATQAAALIPDAVGDLEAAEAWDRYQIIAALNPDNLSISGTVTLDLRNRTGVALDRLYFHLYPNHPDFGGRLNVTSATVNGNPVASEVQYSDTLLALKLESPLAPEASAQVILGFRAQTPRAASRKTFGAFNYEAGVWSMANFYPILARYFPDSGWDTRPIVSRGDFTVSSVALYDVTIDAPQGWRLIGSGVSISNTEVNESIQRQRFVSGPQREFYFAALQGLHAAETVVDGTRIVSYFQPGMAEAGQKSLEIAEQSLRAFNNRYGPYPLAELEVIQSALTQFYGMEYPGVVLIEQSLYKRPSDDFEVTIAHEIAHQWWYSQVGNDAQGEAWLDEGLASYAQVIYYEEIGQPDAVEEELQYFRSTFHNARAAGRDAPLDTPASELGGGRYYPLNYAKAPLFFHALRRQIGDAGFTQFLQNYYAAYRYQDVTGEDLLHIAEQTCGCELDTLYHDWVETSTRVGIP